MAEPQPVQFGIVLPQTELGSAVKELGRYVRVAENLGFDHLLAYDHVVGADPAHHPGWSGHYDIDTDFREVMVILGFLAAHTSMGLGTGVLVLPQRQTVLLAKQAAEVDILCGGRLRLGVGVGWNSVEHVALGHDFSRRGARTELQIPVLRKLWTQESVVHHDEVHELDGVGLRPLPVQRPIPIWIGGNANSTFSRIGRLADGWFPLLPPGPELERAKAIVAEAAHEAGRDPTALGMQARIVWTPDERRLVEQVETWRDAGATHIAFNTMGHDLRFPEQHLDALQAVAAALDLDHPATPAGTRDGVQST